MTVVTTDGLSHVALVNMRKQGKYVVRVELSLSCYPAYQTCVGRWYINTYNATDWPQFSIVQGDITQWRHKGPVTCLTCQWAAAVHHPSR
jgi:hypothetical protein